MPDAAELVRVVDKVLARVGEPAARLTAEGRLVSRLENHVQAAQQAALEMKHIADMAQKALRAAETELEELYDRIDSLETENRMLRGQLRRQRRELMSEKITEAYDDALTQFLVPADPSGIQP